MPFGVAGRALIIAPVAMTVDYDAGLCRTVAVVIPSALEHRNILMVHLGILTILPILISAAGALPLAVPSVEVVEVAAGGDIKAVAFHLDKAVVHGTAP